MSLIKFRMLVWSYFATIELFEKMSFIVERVCVCARVLDANPNKYSKLVHLFKISKYAAFFAEQWMRRATTSLVIDARVLGLLEV